MARGRNARKSKQVVDVDPPVPPHPDQDVTPLAIRRGDGEWFMTTVRTFASAASRSGPAHRRKVIEDYAELTDRQRKGLDVYRADAEILESSLQKDSCDPTKGMGDKDAFDNFFEKRVRARDRVRRMTAYVEGNKGDMTLFILIGMKGLNYTQAAMEYHGKRPVSYIINGQWKERFKPANWRDIGRVQSAFEKCCDLLAEWAEKN